MSAVLEYPQRHAVSAEEYLRMGEGEGGYRTSFTVSGGESESVAALALPAIVVPVAALFPA